MKVLMLGWEFPPFFAGGVGIVCYELTRELLNQGGLEITYVMPYGPTRKANQKGVEVMFANHVLGKGLKIEKVDSLVYAYDSFETYAHRIRKFIREDETEDAKNKSIKEIYGKDVIQEVYLYAKRVARMCEAMDFDIIHAHDWTTIPAAVMLKELTGKPLMVHVHITELNKTGGQGGHPRIFEIERFGFRNADIIVAVSNYVRNILIESYGIGEGKIRVVHNGGTSDLQKSLIREEQIGKNERIVLFAGRLTQQKGVEYFVRAAKRVLEYDDQVRFIIAGTGDQQESMCHFCYELGIQDKVLFYGFYSRGEAEMLFSMADVFVMPSVSEPFGIVPLEAVARGTPTIISKQSGISEVLNHTFKVDFWDIDDMANKIIGLLTYEVMHNHMRNKAYEEFDQFTWEKPAAELQSIYRELVNNEQ